MRQLLRGSRMAAALFLFVTLAAAPTAQALEGRLLQPDGTPAGGYEVSVVGRSVTVTTNADGRFTITPDPRFPFQIVALGPQGEVSPAIDVTRLPESGILEIPCPPRSVTASP